MSEVSDDADELRSRLPGSDVWVWLVLDADRRLVAVAFLAIIFCTMVAVGVLLPTPAYERLTTGDPTDTLFNALVGTVITGVTLVLTLSQIVLSQELGPAGDQRERMEGALSFRDDVAEAADERVAPMEPSSFLRGLVAATGRQAQALAAEAPGGDAGEAVDAYAVEVTEHADVVTDQLEGAEFGDFEVVRAALNYDYSSKIHWGEHIMAEHGDELGEDASDALEELLTQLKLFGPAREHFKTLYFQWDLSDLSRELLYAAMPSLAVAAAVLALFDPAMYPGSTLGVNHALLVVSTATAIAVLPFAILLSYILRIVTITKYTLAIGPFVLRETNHNEVVDYRE
jgi:hypothetical protein